MPTNTLVRWVIETLGIEKRPIKDYFCLSWQAAVITGLAYTQWFVNVAVVQILITYFTDTWEKHNVLSFAVLLGMVMLCISAFQPIPGNKGGVYFAATVLLISVGKAGGLPILEEFLVCQLRAHEPSQLDIDEGRVHARKNVWWNTTKLLCNLSTPLMFTFGISSWPATVMLSASVMVIGYFLFWCCKPLYHHRSLDEDATTPEIPRGASPEENTNNGPTPAVSPEIPRGASHEEITNNDPTPAVSSEIPRGASPEENTNNGPTPAVFAEIPRGASPEENTNNGLTPAVFAEIPRGASPEENTNNGPTLTISAGRRLMEQCRPLFIMIPMWTSFLVFGLVLSTGDTFFTDQASTLKPTVSIYIIVLMQKMTKYTSSFFSTLLLKQRKTKGITVGIWTAMLVSVFCCYFAWRVEIRRLRVIGEHKKICKIYQIYGEVVIVPMSNMRLAPQFCLLGLMEGIGRKGLDLFFGVQVSDVPMKKYGSALNEAVIGLGSFLNAILVFRFKSWFSDTSNCNSRLDKYYQMLMILSFVNLCYYSGFVSIYYSNKNKTKDDLQVEAAGAGVV